MKEDPNKWNQKWKKRNNNGYHRNTKDCKKTVWTNMCQEIGQPVKNGQVSRIIQSPKTQPGRRRTPGQVDNN